MTMTMTTMNDGWEAEENGDEETRDLYGVVGIIEDEADEHNEEAHKNEDGIMHNSNRYKEYQPNGDLIIYKNQISISTSIP